jgi:hypothetical protein
MSQFFLISNWNIIKKRKNETHLHKKYTRVDQFYPIYMTISGFKEM